MGIFQSLVVGATSLQAQGLKIGLISDNISNVNTVGYKNNVASFANLIGSETVNFSPSGAKMLDKQFNDKQGEIFSTQSPTDIAVSGRGFFTVSDIPASADGDTKQILYTRAGSFLPDTDGNLRNGAGFFLQGWLLEDGELPADLAGPDIPRATALQRLVTVNPSSLDVEPIPTTEISVSANLTSSHPQYSGLPAYDADDTSANMASGSIPPHFSIPVTVVDSAGNLQQLQIGFLTLTQTNWMVEVYADNVAAPDVPLLSGRLGFANGDGTLTFVENSLSQAMSVTWLNDDENSTNSITFDWGTLDTADGMTQLDDNFLIHDMNQNGFQAGDLSNVEITDDGTVIGNYSSGLTRALYRIPLALFYAPEELKSENGTVYIETLAAGEAQFTEAKENGAGEIASQALESSTVDLASQLTDMIIAQRSYQTNTKVINTTDSMLQVLDEML